MSDIPPKNSIKESNSSENMSSKSDAINSPMNEKDPLLLLDEKLNSVNNVISELNLNQKKKCCFGLISCNNRLKDYIQKILNYCSDSSIILVVPSSLVSLILSFGFPQILQANRNFFRPTLNIFWALLFGSSTWIVIFGNVFRKILPKHTIEKVLGTQFRVFFPLSTISACFVQCSTVSLAPSNKVLVYGSTLGLLSSLINTIWIGKKTSEIMSNRIDLESKYNLGSKKISEIEDLSNIQSNPKDYQELQKLNKNFRFYHNCSLLLGSFEFISLIPYIFF